MTTSVEGFKFGVTKLITDTTPGLPRRHTEGLPKRICDQVFNIVRGRLHGCDAFGTGGMIATHAALTERDERLQGLRSWWKAKGDRIQWSSDRMAFIVRP